MRQLFSHSIIHSFEIQTKNHTNAVLLTLNLADSFASVIDGNHPAKQPKAMKKLILFLFITLAFSACKKGENDVTPQKPANAVAGNYSLTSFYYNDGSTEIDPPKMPYTVNGQTLSGTVRLTPTSETNVTLTLTLKVTGQKDSSIDIDNVEVKKTSEAYGLYVDNELVADADGSNIIFNLNETDPQTGESLELKFNAKK